MNTILLLGQTKTGRHTLLEQCHPTLKKETHGLITAWTHQHTQFITTEQSLTGISTLPRIDAVAILIELPSLLDESRRLATINWITTQLSALKDHRIPIQFIISKADMLPGFREYFSSYTAEARTQALGIARFSDKQSMLDTISRSLLEHLHQEPLIEKRVHLQALPQQLDRLITLSEDIVTRSLNNDWLFGGLFLISCKQKPMIADLLTGKEKPSLPILSQKIYFVSGLLDHLKLLATTQQKKRKQKDIKRWLAIPLSLVLITGCIALWHTSYRQSVIAIANVTKTLKSVEHNPNDPAWLAQMNHLQAADRSLNTPGSRYARFLGLPQTSELKEQLHNQYQRLLTTKFLPEAEGQLTDAITQHLSDNPVDLYATLRIYLMLATGQHRDPKAIEQWFQTHWQPQKQAASILPHVNNLLSLPTQQWPIDKALVKQAQSTLQALPVANIAYLHLQAPYLGKATPLSAMLPQQPYFDIKNITLPTFFSTTQFNQLFNESIPAAVKSLLKNGDWVIGVSQSDFSDETPAQLTAPVRVIFVSAFSQTWQNIIPRLRLKPFQTMQQIETFVSDLIDHQSALHQLLSFIVGNATLDKQGKPSKDTQQLSRFLNQKQTPDQLKNIQFFIQTINKSADPNHASLAVASTILSNSTDSNPLTRLISTQAKPTLIHRWYNQIGHNMWRLLLEKARQALDKKWQQTIMPLYTNSIEGHYPIDTNSQRDISPSTFTNFFGPHGALDVFVETLKPFINTQQHYWTWKRYLGRTLGPPQSLLDNLMRALLIQQMFYSDHAKSPRISFNLVPMTKSSQLETVTSYFDGQKLPFDKTVALSQTIQWPGPKKIGASWVITLTNGHQKQHFVSGPWAAFRLIQSGKLVPSTNPQKYTLTFHYQAHEWQYLLIPSKKINPWLPQVIPEFSLPKTLLKS